MKINPAPMFEGWGGGGVKASRAGSAGAQSTGRPAARIRASSSRMRANAASSSACKMAGDFPPAAAAAAAACPAKLPADVFRDMDAAGAAAADAAATGTDDDTAAPRDAGLSDMSRGFLLDPPSHSSALCEGSVDAVGGYKSSWNISDLRGT